MSGLTNPAALTHSAVTLFADGTVIPPGTITKYQYGFGQTKGQYSLIKDDLDLTTDATGKQYYLTPVLPAFGQWYSAARAVTKDGAVAPWGNEVEFMTAAKEPKPITDFACA